MGPILFSSTECIFYIDCMTPANVLKSRDLLREWPECFRYHLVYFNRHYSCCKRFREVVLSGVRVNTSLGKKRKKYCFSMFPLTVECFEVGKCFWKMPTGSISCKPPKFLLMACSRSGHRGSWLFTLAMLYTILIKLKQEWMLI